MKRLNKVLSVLFLFLLVCSSCLPFAAAEDLDTPVNEDISVDLQYISIANCNLTIVNGTAHISSIVSGTPGSTTKCKITLSLQQKSLLWWSTVESYAKRIILRGQRENLPGHCRSYCVERKQL